MPQCWPLRREAILTASAPQERVRTEQEHHRTSHAAGEHLSDENALRGGVAEGDQVEPREFRLSSAVDANRMEVELVRLLATGWRASSGYR